MKPKLPLTAAIVVGATMVATVGVGLIVLRDDPSAPASAPSPPSQRPLPPPAKPPAPPPAPPKLASDGGGPSSIATPAPASSPNAPCKIAREGNSPVADACRRGGQEAAKRFMKTVVNRTKDRPDRVTCDTCHENVDDFTLQEDARERLAQVLESLGVPLQK